VPLIQLAEAPYYVAAGDYIFCQVRTHHAYGWSQPSEIGLTLSAHMIENCEKKGHEHEVCHRDHKKESQERIVFKTDTRYETRTVMKPQSRIVERKIYTKACQTCVVEGRASN